MQVEEEEATLQRVEKEWNALVMDAPDDEEIQLSNTTQSCIWEFLNDPDSSFAAKVNSILLKRGVLGGRGALRYPTSQFQRTNIPMSNDQYRYPNIPFSKGQSSNIPISSLKLM